jgi:hypothetical protein
MRTPKLALAALLTGGFALGGCAYGYDPYGGGYGGVSVGYGAYNDYGYYNPYYYGGFGRPYYGSSYGYGYGGYPYFGWYDNFYYPGTGIYVYDRYRTRHVWSDAQRRYWEDRHNHWQSTTKSTATVTPRENWSGFSRDRSYNRNDNVTTTRSYTTRSHVRSSDDGDHTRRRDQNE